MHEKEITQLEVGQIDHYLERFAVVTEISQPHSDELHEGFTPEKFLNMG